MDERGVEVEVADVIDGKLGIFTREDAVDYDFYEFERASFSADASGAADEVAADCDTSVVGIFFLGENLANTFGVGDLLASI